MAAEQLNQLVRHIRRVVPGDDAGRTDAELLRRFVTERDEAAFTTLVQRYGPLVLGVCQRVLRHRQDAEDAFPVTRRGVALSAALAHGSALAAVPAPLAARTVETVMRGQPRQWASRWPALSPPESLPGR